MFYKTMFEFEIQIEIRVHMLSFSKTQNIRFGPLGVSWAFHELTNRMTL